MKLKFLNCLNYKKILFFIIGAIVLSGSLGYLISVGINEYILDLDRTALEEMLTYPLRESIVSAFKLYLVAYVLFGTLPDKIKNATPWIRAMYFTLFYIFCVAIYIMI